MRKNKKSIIKRFQSTQQNLPIKDIVEGIIVTKNNEYIKILEVLPVPFFLKNSKQKNLIIDNFKKLLKTGPFDMQIKVMSFPADLSAQLDILNKEIEKEENESCKSIDDEYQNKLLQSQETNVTRRFFITFSFNQKTKIFSHSSKLETAIHELNNYADTMIGYLKQCGNKVIVPKKENANEYVAKLLYIILNRGKYTTESFEDHLNEVYQKYFEAYNSTNFFIPPTDYISPNKIAFIDSKYVVVDDMYYRFAYVPSNGYDSYLSAGWVNIFSNTFIGVDVDVFLNKLPKEQVIGNIRRNMNYSLVGLDDTSVTSEAYDVSGDVLESNSYLKDGLSANEDFYYMSTLVTICDKDPEMVDFKMNELIKDAKSNDFSLKEIVFEAECAFKSALPLCKLDKTLFEKMKRNVLTEGAAMVYPFTAYEINDEDGVYLGDDADNNSLAIVDIYDRDKIKNSNIFICGQTGAGKTYTMLLLAIRMRIKHIPILLIAPEKENEFKRVCIATGGQFIGLGSGTDNCLNIMEIFKRDVSADSTRERIDGVSDIRSQLAEKVDAVKSFIQLLVKDISIEQRQLLDEAIYETYAKFGITRDNESLWADEEKTEYKKMPILEDLYNTIGEKMVNEPSLKSVYNTMKFFVTGSGASFNGQTNVDINSEFTVFGLEHLTEENIPLGVFVAMDFCWSKIKQDATKRKALLIDEWWKMAVNPIAAAYSLEISKVIRAYNGAMILATQQMSDILLVEDGKFGKAVLNNCAIKILMGMSEDDAMKVQEIMLLTNEERDSLFQNEKGKAMFVYGVDKMKIKFIATETEHKLITTDPKQLRELAMEKLKKEKLESEREKIKNAKDISSLLNDFENFVFSTDIVLLETKDIENQFSLNVPILKDTDEYIKNNERS